MTAEKETDRFKAKCASGITHIIIEKTKETKEFRILDEQSYVTTRKLYFLSTGEQVNKLTDKDYLILNEKKKITRRDPLVKKSDITDLKTLFDYLKNQALCIAILITTPEIISTLQKSNASQSIMLLAASIATSMALVFSICNLTWLFYTLEDKPKLKALHIFAIAFILASVVTAMGVAGLKTLQGLIPYFLSQPLID